MASPRLFTQSQADLSLLMIYLEVLGRRQNQVQGAKPHVVAQSRLGRNLGHLFSNCFFIKKGLAVLTKTWAICLPPPAQPLNTPPSSKISCQLSPLLLHIKVIEITQFYWTLYLLIVCISIHTHSHTYIYTHSYTHAHPHTYTDIHTHTHKAGILEHSWSSISQRIAPNRGEPCWVLPFKTCLT